MLDIVHLVILSIMSLIILPLVFSAILRFIGNGNKQYLVNHFGVWSQNTLGGLGVIIHELSHLIIALIFGHRLRSIHDVKFLDLHRPEEGQSMGYVNHYYRKDSVYQCLGNFFIGIAPCFGCSLLLLFVHYLFWGNESFNFFNVSNIHDVIVSTLHNIDHPLGSFGWEWLVFIALIIIVSCTGYGLSSQDWHGTLLGLPYWCVVVLVIDVCAIIGHAYVIYSYTLWILLTILLTFLGWGVVYSLITFVTLFIINKVIHVFR